MNTPDPQSMAAAASVHERLNRALVALATGRGDVRSRLEPAAMALDPLQATDFPAQLQADFRWIMEQLQRYEPNRGEGRIKATLQRIQNSTGEKIAHRIVELHEKVQLIRSGSTC